MGKGTRQNHRAELGEKFFTFLVSFSRISPVSRLSPLLFMFYLSAPIFLPGLLLSAWRFSRISSLSRLSFPSIILPLMILFFVSICVHPRHLRLIPFALSRIHPTTQSRFRHHCRG